MAEMEWDPETYLATMLDEIPGYLELQERTVEATEGLDVRDVLELGTGTGETAARMLEVHPNARWIGIDANDAMLARARERLPQIDLRRRRLEGTLPSGPFDLVVSVLAVHHLDGAGKRDLFQRVAGVLRPQGRFVLGDVVVPERPDEARIFIDGIVDLPDTVGDQLTWLGEAGFDVGVTWRENDLAVVRADRRL